VLTTIRSIFRNASASQAPDPRRDDPVRNPACTEFEVDNWIISEFVAARLVPVVGVHPFPLAELCLLVAAVCRFRPPQIFEWGTNVGKSARIFHETVTHFGIASQVHSIDLPDETDHVEHPHDDRGILVRNIPAVTLHQGDGLETALRLWREGGNRPGPLFMLDGDHSYASVSRELAGVMDAAPNAVILAHDTFYQSAGSNYNIGPYQAIEESLAARPGRYRRISTNTGLPGLTLLFPAAP
jgi:cephalosporin hydroxylase